MIDNFFNYFLISIIIEIIFLIIIFFRLDKKYKYVLVLLMSLVQVCIYFILEEIDVAFFMLSAQILLFFLSYSLFPFTKITFLEESKKGAHTVNKVIIYTILALLFVVLYINWNMFDFESLFHQKELVTPADSRGEQIILFIVVLSFVPVILLSSYSLFGGSDE